MKRLLLSLVAVAAIVASAASAQAGHGHRVVYNHHHHVRTVAPIYVPLYTAPRVHLDVVPHANLYGPGYHLHAVPHVTVPQVQYQFNNGVWYR